MNRPTKGSIEAEISNAVVKFHREQHGRGPSVVRTYLLGDMVLVRCADIFTPTEAKLAGSVEGRRLIKSARQELRSINRKEIEAIISGIAGCEVSRSYCDIDVNESEQVELYIMGVDLERRLLRKELDLLGGLTTRPEE